MTVALGSLLEAELAAAGVCGLKHYVDVMKEAFESNPPPFAFAQYGERYRAHAMNPYWLIQSLISNSVKEGQGARDLWELAFHIEVDSVRKKVIKHAQDEARHARQYIGLLRIVFPEALSKDDEKYILSCAPIFGSPPNQIYEPYSAKKLADLLIQINLGEFRTRLHQLLMVPVLSCICAGREKRLLAALDLIGEDELQHLSYTSCLIDDWLAEGNLESGKKLVALRLGQFNELTTRELGEQVFH